MFVKGITQYNKLGKEVKTGIIFGRATKDGEFKEFESGKQLGTTSAIAYTHKDGTATFLNVKGWGHLAIEIGRILKGDRFLAAGTLEIREYEGKTYTDLIAEVFFSNDSHSDAFELPNSGLNSSENEFSDLEENDDELPF